jgi:hypothetical protein
MNNLNDLLNEVKAEKLEQISPSFRQNAVSEEQIKRIIKSLNTKYTSLEEKYILVAIILLFLKGVSSNNTPETLAVEVKGVTITKRDLKIAIQQILNHGYIRRVAESIAVQIGTYAELNGLDGELAKRIDKIIAENNYVKGTNELPLTTKERAWCSSFSQGLSNLEQYTTERVVKYLAIDYNERFGRKPRVLQPNR